MTVAAFSFSFDGSDSLRRLFAEELQWIFSKGVRRKIYTPLFWTILPFEAGNFFLFGSQTPEVTP